MEYDSDSDVDVVGSDEDVAVIGRDDVSNYNEANILPEPAEVIDKIRKWLEPTSYLYESGEYRRHLAAHLEGTGQWLSATPNFKKWHRAAQGGGHADHGLLWVKGIPGSGKSVYAATIADELAKEGHPVLFFFFRQIINANHTPVNLLRDWLDQVLEYSPPLQIELKDYVDERGGRNRSLDSLGMDALWNHLKTALAHLPRVYLVADALDEMDKGNDGFLKALAKLGSWKPERVKVLITSRPVTTVEAPLREFPALQIRLEERLVDMDIAIYVQHGIDGSSIPAQDRVLIREVVPGRVNGLFLYAKLAMDAFLEPDADVREVLRTLPADLDAMYTDLLREHARRSGTHHDIQLLILSWVTHATRPLRLIEVAEMVNTSSNLYVDCSLKAAKDVVRAACGPLLEIHPDETVSVIHHSLTEFLMGSTRAAASPHDDSQAFPVLLPGPTHQWLALCCLRYLQSGCLDGHKVSKSARDEERYSHLPVKLDPQHVALRLQFPFLDYAAKNWPTHVLKSAHAGWISTILPPFLDAFFVPGQRLDMWLDIEWRPCATKDVTPCHIAARYGLTQYLEHISGRSSVEVNCKDATGKTPLFHAAGNGHAEAVKILINVGANPDQDDSVGLKPLHRAAALNHASVISVLLAAGVDPLTAKTRETSGRRCGNASRSKGETPLMYACQSGHVEAVEAFLPSLKEINTVHRALNWAAKSGQTKLVKRLIRVPGIDVNAKVRGDTPFFLACFRRDIEAMEALLAAGADATVLCSLSSQAEFPGAGNYGGLYGSGSNHNISTLDVFCFDGRGRDYTKTKPSPKELKDGLDILLQAGLDVNRRDSSLKTPLHHALGNPVLMRLLLLTGADPNTETSDGSTLLHTPVQNEEVWEILKSLVVHGKVDVNKRRKSDGQTPLMFYLTSKQNTRRENTIRFLEEFWPDCTIVDNTGTGPLHAAARERFFGEGQCEVIVRLVENDARLDQRTPTGLLPIHVAKEPAVVEQLVELGADLEARDYAGATPLMRTPRFRVLGIKDGIQEIDFVLSLGAKIDTRDFRGRTLLHEVVRQHLSLPSKRNQASPLLQHLVDLGLDPKSVDYSGNTLLHELAFIANNGSHEERFKQLVRLGVDPDAANNFGQTMLHVLCSKIPDHNGHRPENRLLSHALPACKEIDAMDHEGNRPIHFGATVSESIVAQLIDAGADVSAATKEGLTPLHVAAWARESNTVGLLLAAISTGNYGDPETIINATAFSKSRSGGAITPLYYACLSGRPESVTLLLEAGAKVKDFALTLLEACSEFEVEDKRWIPPNDKRWIPLDEDTESGSVQRVLATNVHIKRGINAVYGYGHNSSFLSERNTARLEEILQMLADHGLPIPAPGDSKFNTGVIYAHNAINQAISLDSDYAAACLMKLQVAKESSEPPQLPPFLACNARFTTRWASLRRGSAAQALRESNAVPTTNSRDHSREQDAQICLLLTKREFELVEASLRGPLLPNRLNGNGRTALHTFAAFGYANLLSKLATEDDVKKFDNVEWRMRKEQEKNTLGNRAYPQGSIWPLIATACQRELPNMEVLRFLVEQLKGTVNVSQLEYKYQADKNESIYVTGDSPLHFLARGRHWWQANQALPYLLSRKPDLEIRNHEGETPLHKALADAEYGLGIFHKHAARILIQAGADVNAVTNNGRSCLAVASYDAELTRLLVESGARVTAVALFAAIDNKRPDVLELLLATGANANMRHDPEAPKKRSPIFRESTPWGYYSESGKVLIDLARVLLAHGADPLALFLRPPKNAQHEKCTIFHDILACNGIVEPLLECLPAVDLEHRDGRGRTVLLAAFTNPKTSNRKIRLDNSDKEQMIIDVLLQRGADGTARDNDGRNALHTLFNSVREAEASPPFKEGEFEDLLQLLISASPALVNQVDAVEGKTPLHYALDRETGGSPCLVAVGKGDLEVGKEIDMLLEAGADPTLVDGEGNSSLHFLARRLGRKTKVRNLFSRFLELGLDINARNANGETPLFDYAKKAVVNPKTERSYRVHEGSEKDIWELFESAGADFTAKDSRGRGLLHVAAKKNKWVTGFQALLRKGLGPISQDDKQMTCLDVAAACGNAAVLALFEKEGENKRAQESNENESEEEQSGDDEMFDAEL
ncbi:ankyrin repeat-containing domain protein [Lasiosphaeria miniovina]|uniref:Ankyrin repeat-containing domain protein n=1 Tax=Lasiosphaeria miniovina TaxID=1954250 RepID=A0AA40DTJ9_9PEZI|nr:ankyrin repeat-containing domain protein [Lasiosphaeria miniovina]KAK0712926.1 ankyrin repeat-containing domain protein [Lasiosphaeria miniovina]